ncbi:alpha-L-fucosidase [Weeksellaceae bacterium TAE3-ERU29]|nr:alpha-L-fucosidase [Weeksellaceae bacterium TAE3-ERU29]
MINEIKNCISPKLLALATCVCIGHTGMVNAQEMGSVSNDSLSNVGAYLHGNQPSKIQLPTETLNEYNDRMQWWKDDKYGMFIHFGLYSLLGGEYKGEVTPKIAEWIQNTLRIPLKDYQKLMQDFNPKNFDAKAIVKLAKDAGMKYLVITSKHHDGFALFDSKVSDYNIMNTPYNKDIIRELNDECKKQGIKFGLYYSHMIDWENPYNYIGDSDRLRDRMNLVDFNPKKEDRKKYLEEKAFPQLREILTNYGKIDLIWYDMGEGLTNDEVREFVKITRELQPDIIISSRIGDFPEEEDLHRDMLFDYYTPSDNYYTGKSLRMPWEMAGTLNGSWGYRKDDHEWRSADFIIQSLIASISRDGNYLLNIGPDGTGKVPEESAKQLEIAGKWIKKNAEAIYGTHSSPFPWNYDWGYVTQKPNKIFLHVVTDVKTDKIYLPGLLSKVTSAKVVENKQSVKFSQKDGLVTINLPTKKIDDLGYVIEVDLNDKTPNIDKTITQGQNGVIRLDRIASDYNMNRKMTSWDFEVKKPGTYKIELISNEKGNHHKPEWVGSDQEGSIQIGGKIIPVKLTRDKEKINPTLFFYKEITSNIGTFTFDKPGIYTLHLKGFDIAAGKWKKGLGLDRIELLPVK